ncbi:hypothetical protein DFQ28_007157, partial [Apophysomyces sp. BC1034]
MDVSDDESDDGIRLENLTNMKSYLAWQKKGDEQFGAMELDEEQQQRQEEQEEQQTKQQKKQQKKAKTYKMYSDEIKVLVITYHLEKLVSAANAAQQWIKEYKRQQNNEEPEEIEKKKPGPKKTLGEEHKNHLKQFIDDNPSAVLNQAMDSLTQQFDGLKIKKISCARLYDQRMQHLLQESPLPCIGKKQCSQHQQTIRLDNEMAKQRHE